MFTLDLSPHSTNFNHFNVIRRSKRNETQASRVEESLESLVSKFMQVAIVFNLAVGSKRKPVDVQFIGPGCSLPILKHRLQRLFNRKIMKSIVSYDVHHEALLN